MHIITVSVPCLNPGPPSTNFLLRWDRRTTIAVYECPPGYIFNEGGTIRTLGCNTGQWPDLLPVCHGTNVSQTQTQTQTQFIKKWQPEG